MSNVSFICGRHEQNHQIRDELCDKKPFIFRVFAYKYYQLKKANKGKLAVQYFACLVLLATVAIKFIQDAFYFAHHFHSLATHLLVRHVGLLRCPLSLPGALFLRLLLFSLRRCGVASPGRSALALVPELHVSSFRHAAWLNFAGFALLVTSSRIASCYPQQSVASPSCLYLSWQSVVQLFGGFGKQFV